jgi:MFS transporter, DHA1 family, solute carrier family 18 (vesicular acetylcholine transporter), member 3
MTIYGLIVPIAPFRLDELGYLNVSSLTGWLISAYAAGLIIGSPVAGWIGESIDNRRTPLLINLLIMIGTIVMFMLSRTFALLIISRILQCADSLGCASIRESNGFDTMILISF